jgi:hypothetical protein
MRLAKKLLITLIAFAALLIASALGIAQYFSREQPPVTKAEAEASLHAAIGWMKANEADVLGDGNQALWRMVRISAELTHDPDLARMYASYYERYYQRGRTDVWEHWVNPAATTPVTLNALENLAAYQHLFIYASTCNAALGADPYVSQQLSADYCAPALPRALRGDPTCSTHQLMGLAMMLERGCGDAAALKRAIPVLQADIVTQLRYDPRARDEYIQRVQMLYETGAAASIRPAWLRRVIQTQQPDGGWTGLRSIKLLFGDLAKSVGLPDTPLSNEEMASNFHATAQGLLLMSRVVADLSKADSPSPAPTPAP